MPLAQVKPMENTASPAPTFAAFRKRSYTLPAMAADLRAMRPFASGLWAVYARKRIDRALREQVMVAVAEVNECRYCTYTHHEWALLAGVDRDENDPTRASLGGGGHREQIAVAYVQTLADRDFAPVSADLESQVREHFTRVEQRDIVFVARLMRLFNLSGNTLDALQSRMRRAPAPNSRILDEVLIGALFSVAIVVVCSGMGIAKRQSPLTIFRELMTYDPTH